jgi:hypothetical protein
MRERGFNTAMTVSTPFMELKVLVMACKTSRLKNRGIYIFAIIHKTKIEPEFWAGFAPFSPKALKESEADQ